VRLLLVIDSSTEPAILVRMRTSTALLLGLGFTIALSSSTAGQVPTCGNGQVEPPERCDDGNLIDGDGCDSNCTPTGCGNGIITAGEECDDGNLVSGDCCSATCMDENRPPDCHAAEASISGLWPPNHKFVPVRVIGVTDPDGDPIVIRVTAIAQDEPLDAAGSGATCPDATGVGLDTASLRSERSGQGDGRVYHVAFRAIDRCNAACTGEVTVCVAHDRRPNGACGDGGPLYDATAGAPPCQGESCGPEDCVPDPKEIAACDGDHVPRPVEAALDRAHGLLAGVSGGRGRKLGRAAARQLEKAARRARRAAKHGDLSDGCAGALTDALDGGKICAACSVER
jgi:cysteine-rich repeat protein